MAHTPPRRLARFSRAFTSILTAGVLVAGGLTYTAIEAPAPAAAEPCIPGSSPTCPPGPQPTGPTSDPTAGQTTPPQAATTTPPGAQQPTEAPSDPTPNQGGNGMNVQTPNQPATTNPNGIFGQTSAPTAQQPNQPPTTAAQPPTQNPTVSASPTTQASNQQEQCLVQDSSAVQGGNLTYSATPELTALAQQAANSWGGGPFSISPASGGASPGVTISSINDPGQAFGAAYTKPLGGGPATIVVNFAYVDAGNPAAVASAIAHEMGHAQGLGHSSTPGSIMAESGALPGAPTPADIQALSAAKPCGTSGASANATTQYWCPLGSYDHGGCRGGGVAKKVGYSALCIGAIGAALYPGARLYFIVQRIGKAGVAKLMTQHLRAEPKTDEIKQLEAAIGGSGITAKEVILELTGIGGIMTACSKI